MTPAEKHSLRSSESEEYVEYIFLAAICSHGWAEDRFVEVSRSKTDAFGYDLVLTSGTVTRHVQLKASRESGATRLQKINVALGSKPSGCVVWLKVDDTSLNPSVFAWFGDVPGKPLPDLGTRVAKHSKGNSTGEKNYRPGIREVGWGKFTYFGSIAELFVAMFGKVGP